MKKWIVWAFLAFFCAACSSDGSNNQTQGAEQEAEQDTEQTVQVLVGHLNDPVVEGLRYNTPTQTGETGIGGSFRYIPGEIITFSIGDIVLWEGEAVGDFSALKIDVENLPTQHREIISALHSSTDFSAHINKLRFILALDGRRRFDDNIQIDDDLQAESLPSSLLFRRPANEFSSDAEIIQFVEDRGQVLSKASTVVEAMYRLRGIDIVDARGTALYSRTSSEWQRRPDGSYGTVGYAEFDVDGRLTYTNFYNMIYVDMSYEANGLLESIATRMDVPKSYRYYRYTTAGQVAELEIDANADGMINMFFSYTYDQLGRSKSYSKEYPHNPVNNETYDYVHHVDGGYSITKTLYEAHHPNRKYTYDQFDQLVRDVSYDDDGSIRYEIDFEYDQFGNMTLKYGRSGQLVDIETRDYDSAGYIIRMERTRDGATVEEEAYVNHYDDLHRLIRVDFYLSGNTADERPSEITRYEYDDNGFILQMSRASTYDGAKEMVSDFSNQQSYRIDHYRHDSVSNLQNLRVLKVDL